MTPVPSRQKFIKMMVKIDQNDSLVALRRKVCSLFAHLDQTLDAFVSRTGMSYSVFQGRGTVFWRVMHDAQP
ncbi:hypothetical protein SAMN05216593_107124 [Pseudomonas asturiensis]|uniref:Uncharacterized protein n=1 Tax=Pseudomonas asturiensis TaxID=1190415 RepID=A0A1M7NX91_9PSED|nr:hypothetical protein SAMN05216593_107124 [Pseudomonas asturiensis]